MCIINSYEFCICVKKRYATQLRALFGRKDMIVTKVVTAQQWSPLMSVWMPVRPKRRPEGNAEGGAEKDLLKR